MSPTASMLLQQCERLLAAAKLIEEQFAGERTVEGKRLLWNLKERHLQMFWQLHDRAKAACEREMAGEPEQEAA